MFKKVVPISAQKHKDIKIKPIDNFNFVKDVHLASVVAHEFARASSLYPIVFLEDKEQFRPVVLLGLEKGENLFVQEDGKWRTSYVPAIIRRYPFALLKINNQEGNYAICIDEESEFVNTEEGEPLFNEDGTPSKLIERVKEYLSQLYQMEQFTEEFCKVMKEENMFTPLNIRVRIGNEMKYIEGAYVINEERLNSLSDEKFLEFRKKRYLPVIYSHLSSLAQIERLLRLKEDKSEEIGKIEDRFEETETK